MAKRGKLIGYYPTKESAIRDLGSNIDWYDPTNPDRFSPVTGQPIKKGYIYGTECFYCGDKTAGYLLEELSNGQIIGKPVCQNHFRRPNNPGPQH